jgi:hypothetical protein
LNNLESQLTLYIEEQRIIHLFIKLWSKLRVALTNYQNLLIIKKELLILTNRLKNNMKKIIDAQTTFDNRSWNFKTSQSKNRKKNEKRDNENSFNDILKMKNRRKNIDEKKRKRANHFHLICYKCNEVEHIVINYFDLKKNSKLTQSLTNSKNRKSQKEKSHRRRLINRWKRRINKIWDQFNTKDSRRRRSNKQRYSSSSTISQHVNSWKAYQLWSFKKLSLY